MCAVRPLRFHHRLREDLDFTLPATRLPRKAVEAFKGVAAVARAGRVAG